MLKESYCEYYQLAKNKQKKNGVVVAAASSESNPMYRVNWSVKLFSVLASSGCDEGLPQTFQLFQWSCGI